MECLKKKEVPVAYIRVIKNMYEGVQTCARTSEGDTDDFSSIGFHQESTLKMFLFTIITDELAKRL